jgi:sugar/nucleoside kinase (ribokinase family)
MARVDLLAVGEAFEDLVFVGLPHLPAPGEEVKTSRFTQTFGGGAVRTAVAAARLGISARVVSALSTGAVAFLKSEKVAVRNLREPNEPHAITAALSTRDNRSFVTFNGVNDVLEPRLLQAMRGELARHIHFALSPHNCGRWLPILRNMRDHDVAISWDFGWNPPLLEDEDLNTLVGLLDFLFVNEQEAMLYSRRETLAEAIAFWKARTANLILKQGAKGSRWISPEMDLFGRPRRVKSVDTTGAGHAFNGAFLCARLRGFSPEASLRLANFVWAMATRFPGGIAGIPRHGLD